MSKTDMSKICGLREGELWADINERRDEASWKALSDYWDKYCSKCYYDYEVCMYGVEVTTKKCYGKCDHCAWYRNGGCSEWNGLK